MNKYCKYCGTDHPLDTNNRYRLEGSPQCKIHFLKVRKAYRENNRDKVRACSRLDYYKNKSRRIEVHSLYIKNRRQTDPMFRLRMNLRRRIGLALTTKQGKTMDLVGCSISALREHLETQFKDGMSWENYGAWHVDHIRPLRSFDLSDELQCKQSCHYTNLQPLWAADNLSKGGKCLSNS